MNAKSMAVFDPRKLARYEKENYVSYYQRRWLKLLVASVSMVKEAYHLSLFQAARGAYLIARAEMAFAPFPNNDLPRAEAYLRRFFRLLQRVHGLSYDLDQVVKVEINWWIVHRQLFAEKQNQLLVDALAESMAVTYGLDPETAREAACWRALGMLYSDQWVRAGLDTRSPLLEKEEKALRKGYSVLKQALAA